MATKNTTLATTVYRITRGPVSSMGNPSFIFHTADGTYRTSANIGAAYALENEFPINTDIAKVVCLTLTPARRVTDWFTTKN
jgi:hypothetical protein